MKRNIVLNGRFDGKKSVMVVPADIITWHDEEFAIWHQARAKWQLIDLPSGMMIWTCANRKDLINNMTDHLHERVLNARKKDFYKRECEAIEEWKEEHVEDIG